MPEGAPAKRSLAQASRWCLEESASDQLVPLGDAQCVRRQTLPGRRVAAVAARSPKGPALGLALHGNGDKKRNTPGKPKRDMDRDTLCGFQTLWAPPPPRDARGFLR